MTRSDSKLTMSSSSQVSSSDTQLSTYKLKPPTYLANELQEVTSCTKEIARLTPPPHDGVALRPTVLTYENHTPNGISSYQTNYFKNVRSSNVSKMSSNLNDKQCQTDDVIVTDVPKNLSDHSTGDAESTGSSKNDINTQFISMKKQQSDTRSLNHIDVIVTETQPNKSLDAINPDNEIKEDETDNKVNHDVKKDVIQIDEKLKDDKDEDSCCVKCLLFTLQVCDCCVIL